MGCGYTKYNGSFSNYTSIRKRVAFVAEQSLPKFWHYLFAFYVVIVRIFEKKWGHELKVELNVSRLNKLVVENAWH